MAERFVLDASAVLCLLNDEPGASRVSEVLDRSVISAVNYSEVAAKIVDRGGTIEFAEAMIDPLHLRVIDFDPAQARTAAGLRSQTRQAGLSFGDRACLALTATIAKPSDTVTALTADRSWSKIQGEIGVHVTLIR